LVVPQLLSGAIDQFGMENTRRVRKNHFLGAENKFKEI